MVVSDGDEGQGERTQSRTWLAWIEFRHAKIGNTSLYG